MSRRNIGVAIGIPEPYRTILEQARESYGDPNASDIPPHVTLLPPTAVDGLQLPVIEQHLRRAAAAEAPFEIQLRGTGTFRPVSPVVFVTLVSGISNCERLERVVRSGPLARDTRFNYHPHVTVAHDVRPELLDRAFDEMAHFEARFDVAEFQLFEQRQGVWRPLESFPLLAAGA